MQKSDPDAQFFTDHPDRKAHIRTPLKDIVIDRQRGTQVVDECEREFRSLGEHVRERRRILSCRCDHRGNLLPENRVMKIPFLLFADETVEDTDEILLPIIFELMAQNATPEERGF